MEEFFALLWVNVQTECLLRVFGAAFINSDNSSRLRMHVAANNLLRFKARSKGLEVRLKIRKRIGRLLPMALGQLFQPFLKIGIML